MDRKGQSNSNIVELRLKRDHLRKINRELDEEINKLENRGVTCDLKPQMTALHEYNEIKDVTQMVLGCLAHLENVTVTELHRRYNLPVE